LRLLIAADPGARAHFIASWLHKELLPGFFDVGRNIPTQFMKHHTDWQNCEAKAFRGKKLRVKTSFNMLHLHLYLFLVKNVYPQIPDLDRNQYCFDVTNKMIESAKDWFYHDRQIDETLYDRVMQFSDTFDVDFMRDLFHWFNNEIPSDEYVKVLQDINQMNSIELSKNHSCYVASMILQKEHQLNLPEINRFWSLAHTYETVGQDDLYDTIVRMICQDNYGQSDLHGIGVNERTRHIV
jgi:hypothetical protein